MGPQMVAQQRLGLGKAPMPQCVYRTLDAHHRGGGLRVG
jgi:hypothetical protein